MSDDDIVLNWIGSVDCLAEMGSNDADNDMFDNLCKCTSLKDTSINLDYIDIVVK